MTDQFKIPTRYTEKSAKVAFRSISEPLRRFALGWDGLSGAVLVGPTKAGKSLAAACAAERVASLHPDSDTWVRWTRSDELSRALAGRGGNDDIETMKRSRVLIIDELGYERFPELVLEVIGARHDFSRPTLVTSGLTRAAIADRYGDATLRRILEIGKGKMVDCWPNSGRSS